jgi:hypothetical protein
VSSGCRDDVDPVVVAARGHADVEATMRRGGGDQREGNVHGVALDAVLGGGVAQAHVVAYAGRVTVP